MKGRGKGSIGVLLDIHLVYSFAHMNSSEGQGERTERKRERYRQREGEGREGRANRVLLGLDYNQGPT